MLLRSFRPFCRVYNRVVNVLRERVNRSGPASTRPLRQTNRIVRNQGQGNVTFGRLASDGCEKALITCVNHLSLATWSYSLLQRFECRKSIQITGSGSEVVPRRGPAALDKHYSRSTRTLRRLLW